MEISIIIPVYNGADTIIRTLDSIFCQQEAKNVEVIVVDDCSTDATHYILSNYPPPIKLIRLPDNLRQGGARNEGIKYATGKFIQFLDADDMLVDGAIAKLLKYISDDKDNSDILFFDSSTWDLNLSKEISNLNYQNNTTTPLPGEIYLSTQQVPWTPWLALYRRSYLLDNKIFFIENVRFEDSDFVLKTVLLAKQVRYSPIIAYKYFVNGKSTTNIGDDKQKIEERIMSADRLQRIALEYAQVYPIGCKAILNHYQYKYKIILRRNLWRLKFKDILSILKKYPYRHTTSDPLTKISQISPHAYAFGTTILNPILKSAIYLRKRIK